MVVLISGCGKAGGARGGGWSGASVGHCGCANGCGACGTGSGGVG